MKDENNAVKKEGKGKIATPVIIALLLAGYVIFDVVNVTDLIPFVDSLVAGAGSLAAVITAISRAAEKVKIKKNAGNEADINDVDHN